MSARPEPAPRHEAVGRAPSSPPYDLVPFSKARQLLSDSLNLVASRHWVHALLEIDVTEPRRIIARHRERTGETLSFTAFVTTCVARALTENPRLNAVRKGRRHLAVFKDVDVMTPIEREFGDGPMPANYIVRDAGRKTLRQIHDELRAAARRPIGDIGGLTGTGWMLKLPRFALRILGSFASRSPRIIKRTLGSVTVTSVGMFGHAGGWGMAIMPSTVGATVGSISERPTMVGGALEVHEFLHLTLTFDHDIVDGGPAARFAERLTQLLETAYGLEEARVRPAPDVDQSAPAADAPDPPA